MENQFFGQLMVYEFRMHIAMDFYNIKWGKNAKCSLEIGIYTFEAKIFFIHLKKAEKKINDAGNRGVLPSE